MVINDKETITITDMICEAYMPNVDRERDDWLSARKMSAGIYEEEVTHDVE